MNCPKCDKPFQVGDKTVSVGKFPQIDKTYHADCFIDLITEGNCANS